MRRRWSVFESSILYDSPGTLEIEFSGRGANALFAGEAGGHRWQRIPPNEKRGRIHTSSVTVAVLEPDDSSGFKFDIEYVEFTFTKGSGPGGQRRNKTETCVVALHRPTGISVRSDLAHQEKSKKEALRLLIERVSASKRKEKSLKRNDVRTGQVGAGYRGEKIRTYRQQENIIIDHLSGKKTSLSKWLNGEW